MLMWRNKRPKNEGIQNKEIRRVEEMPNFLRRCPGIDIAKL